MVVTHAGAELESSEDDSISLTSTKASEYSEGHQFEVESILTERIKDGVKEWLVNWVGYPEERHLWVTRDFFDRCDILFKEWRIRKKRIAKGLETEYDTKAWEERVKKGEEEARNRKRRRERKRRRLDQQVDAVLSITDEEDDFAQPATPTKSHGPEEIFTSSSAENEIATLRKRSRSRSKDHTSAINKIGETSNDNEIKVDSAMDGTDERAGKDRDLPNASTIAPAIRGGGPTHHPPAKTSFKVTMEGHDTISPHQTSPNKERTGTGNLDKDPRASPDKPKQSVLLIESPLSHGAKSQLAESASAPAQTRIAPDQARMGPVGRGPAPLTEPRTEIETTARSRKLSTAKAPAGINSKMEPKRRKTLPTTNTGESVKKFKNLAIQNRHQKYRRTEPAPNRDKLVFLDTKTGKNLKGDINSPATASAAAEIKRTQRGEPQPRQPEKFDNVNASVAIEDAQSDGSRQLTAVGEAETRLSASKKDINIQPLTTKPLKIKQQNQLLRSELSAPLKTQPPFNAPTGPSSLQNNTEVSYASSLPRESAMANSNYSLRAIHSSGFAYKHTPTEDETRELWASAQRHIIADMRLAGSKTSNWESLKVKVVCIKEDMQLKLLTLKTGPTTLNLDFKNSILASEFQRYFPLDNTQYLGSGCILAYPKDKAELDKFTNKLAIRLRGGLLFSPSLDMLIYPTGASAWAFLEDNLPPLAKGAPLRVLFFQIVPQNLGSMDPFIIPADNIREYIRANPIQQGQNTISVVFRDLFQIDHKRLITQNGVQKHPPTNRFFLCFIPAGCEQYETDPVERMALRNRVSKEHDLFVDFLDANGAEIYSLQAVDSIEPQNDGAWEYFVQNFESGQIIFHDSCMRQDQMPRLSKLLRHPAINVWNVSLTPMEGKHPHLYRYFPFGGMILITGSLILYRPQEALRIIMWFARLQLPTKAPGTWKIGFRHHILSWLLDIIEACQDTGEDIFGWDVQIIANIYAEVHRLLEGPLERGYALMVYDSDGETPTADAPVVAPPLLNCFKGKKEWKAGSKSIQLDHEIIRIQDENLIRWFAEHAMDELENYRRFHVILGYPKGDENGEKLGRESEKLYGHIEVLSPEQCYSRHNVAPQEELDRMEKERRRKVRERLPIVKAEARKARKEQREATRRDLEHRMQTFREMGCTESEVRAAGRSHLRRIGATKLEIDACAIDMDLGLEDVDTEMKDADAGKGARIGDEGKGKAGE